MPCNANPVDTSIEFKLILFLFDLDERPCRTLVSLTKPDWIPQRNFNILLNMVASYSELETYTKELFTSHLDTLRSWYEALTLEQWLLNNKNSRYLQLLVIKALRPDRFHLALSSWCHRCVPTEIAVDNPFAILKATSAERPVLIIKDTRMINEMEILRGFSAVRLNLLRVFSRFVRDYSVSDLLFL